MVLILPHGHEDSGYVLSFEIGQREGGFYSERTDRQTHRATQCRISMYIHRSKDNDIKIIIFEQDIKRCDVHGSKQA